jgi:outer membrane protein OmpA-like peptidoglycan-associated protein
MDGVVDANDQCAETAKDAKVDDAGCEPDTDGDGVKDSKDQCADSVADIAVTESGCEADSDDDGVMDSKDQCSNSKAGIKIGDDGCEADTDNDGVVDSKDQCASAQYVVVDNKGCEIDTDKDGLIDSKDDCPESEPGAKVGKDGCVPPVDTDKDGIADIYDVCPDNKSAAKVDEMGCEEGKNIVLKGVQFKTDSAELTQESVDILSALADRLSQYPAMPLEIAGHTDSLGDEAYNQWLSEQRAAAVKQFLVTHGIAEKMLTAVGYGPSKPITKNETPSQRFVNRRVELRRK